MDQPDTDIEVDNDSLVDPVKDNKAEQKACLALTPKEKANTKSGLSHVSPLEVFERKFSIGVRSKSMSESLPFTPKNNNNQPRTAGNETGRNCRTPKRLQHQRNVKLDDEDEEDLVFDYSNLSFNSSARTTTSGNTKIPHCQIQAKNLGDNKHLDTTIDINRRIQRATPDICSTPSKQPFSCESQHGVTENIGVNPTICDDVNPALSSNKILDKVSSVSKSSNSRDVEKTNTQKLVGVFSSTQPSTPSMPSYNQNVISNVPSNVDPLFTSAKPSHLPPSTETSDTGNNPSGMSCPSNTSSPSLNTPLRVGFYEIEKTIGRGNFAVVKLARHRITKTEVSKYILVKDFVKSILSTLSVGSR